MKPAQRVVTSARWRWMPGMLVQGPRNGRPGGGEIGPRQWRLAELGDNTHIDGVIDPSFPLPPGIVPVLEDPATLGCLIEIARHATGGDFTLSMGNGWWEMQEPRRSWEGDDTASMIAALVDVVCS